MGMLGYLKDYKKESVLAPLFKLLEASFELLIPLVMADIIDYGIGNRDRHYVVVKCLLLVCLGMTGLASSITAQFFAAKAAVGFSKKLCHALFNHIQTLSYTEIDTVGSATMMTRMTSDINQVQSGLNLFLRLFLRSFCIVFGAMIMAFTIDRKVAMIFVIAIPLLFLIVFSIMIISIPLYQKVQQNLDTILRLTREYLGGIRVIRAFVIEEELREEFVEKNDQLAKLQIFVGRISAVMNPFTLLIINGAIVALIWNGAIQVNAGYLTQGAVVALVNYMSQILMELIKFANLVVSVTKSMASAKRISSLFLLTSSLKMPNQAIKDSIDKPNVEADLGTENAILSFEQVSFTYENAAEESLSDISFSVNKGHTVGIIGDTGSGKSTLVNLIPRFYDITKGRILYRNRELSTYQKESLRKKIGVVPQKAVLFEGTILDNLRWGKENATEEECLYALELAQAKDFVLEKENGLLSQIKQGGKNFSGGQRQRLAIARALVRKPELLILDDSASALDYLTDAKLRRALHTLKESTTVLIVSQRISSIQHADLILVLHDGKLAGSGTHGELLKNCDIYQEIYTSQYKTDE